MMMSVVFVALLFFFILLLLAVVLSLRQRHREGFADWETTFLDHSDKSPRQLIEEIQNELRRLRILKGATVVDTSRAILDETRKTIDEIQERVVSEAGQQLRQETRQSIREQAADQLQELQQRRQELQQRISQSSEMSQQKINRLQEQMRQSAQASQEKLRELRSKSQERVDELQNELESSSAESEQRIQQLRDQLARARERAAAQQQQPQPPSKPQFVGARAGNAQVSGDPRGSYGDQYYCENGSMPDTSYRVLIENEAGRSEPGDLTITVRSFSYQRPHVWFYTKENQPVSGTAVLQADSGNGWQDVKTKEVDNATDLKFGCAPHRGGTSSSSAPTRSYDRRSWVIWSHHGQDLNRDRNPRRGTVDECKRDCDDADGCVGFSWRQNKDPQEKGECWFKKNVEDNRSNSGIWDTYVAE